MAGKKGKGDAKAQSRRASGPGPGNTVDDLARRLAQNELSIQEETLSLPPPATGDVIQEQNLKAALDSPNIFVETTDNDGNPSTVEIEREVALLSPYVQREVLQQGNGVSSDRPIILPNKVTLEILELLLTYCRFHRASGRSDKERKLFDEKFIRLTTRRLCELTSAADALAMKPLVDLTSRALARLIEGKTPEQIRAQFQLPDDLTEEEKLEPVRNFGDDPKIRLLNRLYEKKRRELQKRRDEERKLIADGSTPTLSPEEKRRKDERSVEELLSFIENGGGGGAAATPRGTRKKKGRPARKPSPARPSEEAQHNSSTPMPSVKHSTSMGDSPRSGRSQHNASLPSNLTARKLDSLEASQTPSTVFKPSLEDALGRLQAPAGSAPVESSGDTQEQQSELGIAQQTSELQGGVEQRQQKASGASNRHLSEEDDQQEEDEADDSEASDTDDEEDSDEEEDEADEAAGDSWQVHRKELLPGSIGPLQGPITTLTSLAAFKARFQQPMAPDSAPSMQSTAQAPSQDTLSSPLPAPQQCPQSAQSASSARAADMGSAGGAAKHSNDWQLGATAAEQASGASAAGPAKQKASSLSSAATAVQCCAIGTERAAEQRADLGAASNMAASGVHAAQQLEVGHDNSSRFASSNGTASTPEQHLPLRFQRGEAASAPIEALWEQSANVRAVRAALTAFLHKSGLSQYLSIEPTEAYPREGRTHSEDPSGHKTPVLDPDGPSKQSGLHFCSQNGSAKRSTQHIAEANGSFSIQLHVHHKDNTATLWP